MRLIAGYGNRGSEPVIGCEIDIGRTHKALIPFLLLIGKVISLYTSTKCKAQSVLKEITTIVDCYVLIIVVEVICTQCFVVRTDSFVANTDGISQKAVCQVALESMVVVSLLRS